MATTHVYDLAVKTGEYESNGQTKSRYENVGKVLRNDNGQFMLLKKTFNPAGVDSNGDMIMVSMFEPRQRDGQQSQGGGQQQGGYGGGGQPSNRDLDDSIPF
ncbi:MAG: hypothetical protein GOVbin2937_79 [Prokaryotic dsDNA virus sp.]|nr:MAG: hypothetical protein GOVbin2937_79 [Prokaryotic dsDNA virus sp.]|tara:strand:- start:74 stop:379 length:306 start_codon:yes stop_codon:yes gene_type:complete